jgi:Transcriptional regulator, AbiEi antitoxin, Type IV TA system/Transcriptional regulator, AbiEi antitoxin N-terminal domain
MSEQSEGKLKQLERLLPEGLLVDSAWLSAHDYYTSLRTKYVASGWLEQPARRVYRRPRGQLSWQQVVISLQTILDHRLAVGGRTALELQGYAHYLSQGGSKVYLHGPTKPPNWLTALPLKEQFVYRNSVPLFGRDLEDATFPVLDRKHASIRDDRSFQDAGLRSLAWGQWDWPLTVSASERAILELLDELPDHESFHQVDVLMEGLSDLAPRRLQKLLVRCRSVKVKRLFFFFADRHRHAWLKHIERAAIDLGSGKRMLVKEGRYDPAYQITVPKELDEAP